MSGMPGVTLGLSPYLNLWQIIVEDSFLVEVADVHRLLVVIFVQVKHTEVIKNSNSKNNRTPMILWFIFLLFKSCINTCRWLIFFVTFSLFIGLGIRKNKNVNSNEIIWVRHIEWFWKLAWQYWVGWLVLLFLTRYIADIV